MMGVFRILFPFVDRRSSHRFRDARVKDSVARSEQVLAAHDLLAIEVASVERALARKDLKPSVRPDPS